MSCVSAAYADGAFLTARQAFKPAVERTGDGRVAVTWQIAKGYRLYRHALEFKLVRGEHQRTIVPELPSGDRHEDKFFGTVETYRDHLRALLSVQDSRKLRDGTKIKVTYQGCADAGLCYPPQERTLALDRAVSSSAETNGHAAGAKPGPAATGRPEQIALASRLVDAGHVSTLALFFGLGILLAFTPCILPMIPIVAAIVVGSRPTPGRALGLSMVYVLAMATAYTVFGVVAAYFGANLQAALQAPAVVLAFAGIFVVLALASFGTFEFTVSGAWRQRIEQMGTRGGFIGAGLMGFSAALIAGPCLAPPLVGALLYITDTGDVLLGGAALFALGLGMGLPLIVICLFGARLLPQTGAWMNQVRVFFGVVLLGVALWLTARLGRPSLSLAGWGALTLAYGAYLSTLATDRCATKTLKRTAVFALWLYAGCAGVGWSIGGGQLARPLAGLRDTAHSQESHARGTVSPLFARVDDLGSLRARLETARRSGQRAVVDFYADWCEECARMRRRVFDRPEVRNALAGTVAIQVDVTDYDTADRKLMDRLGVFGPPAILFYGTDGKEDRVNRIVGAVNAAGFLSRLQHAGQAGHQPPTARVCMDQTGSSSDSSSFDGLLTAVATGQHS